MCNWGRTSDGFAAGEVQNAITAASPGDIVVVQAGTYNPFTLNKDLTVTAAPGAIVDINILPFGSNVSVFLDTALTKRIDAHRLLYAD